MVPNFLTALMIFLFVTFIYKYLEILNRISILTDEHTYELSNCASPRYAKPSDRLVEMYKRQATSRKKHLDEAARSQNYAEIYNNMAPEVFCAELAKVGTTDDGGKWMCGPFNLPKNCTIFSLGLNGDISFEEDIQKITNERCRIFSFDAAQQTPEIAKRLKNIRGKAMAAKITKKTTVEMGEYTISDLMQTHMVGKIEILKMDIETYEFYVMEDFLNKHRVSQILVEVHGTPLQTLEFLRMVSRKGYLLFHFEINGAHHHLCEYAFIQENALEDYGATLTAKFLT